MTVRAAVGLVMLNALYAAIVTGPNGTPLRPRLTLPSALAVVGVGALGVYALEVFRVARVQGVFSFDGWAFWVTRGKAIFFFAAVVLAAVWGRRAHAAFAGVLVLGLTLAAASTSVVFPEIAVTEDEAVNPVVRLTAGTVLAISCLTPLLLAGVWAGRARRLP